MLESVLTISTNKSSTVSWRPSISLFICANSSSNWLIRSCSLWRVFGSTVAGRSHCSWRFLILYKALSLLLYRVVRLPINSYLFFIAASLLSSASSSCLLKSAIRSSSSVIWFSASKRRLLIWVVSALISSTS